VYKYLLYFLILINYTFAATTGIDKQLKIDVRQMMDFYQKDISLWEDKNCIRQGGCEKTQ